MAVLKDAKREKTVCFWCKEVVKEVNPDYNGSVMEKLPNGELRNFHHDCYQEYLAEEDTHLRSKA